MRGIWIILVAAVMALSALAASSSFAQNNDDPANLDKCVGWEACKAMQDRIDALKAGAGALADRASNALTPTDYRNYFEKFSFEERRQAKAACLRNLAGSSCPNYLTAAEEERLNPRPKAPPPLSAEVVRSRELQLLQADDNSVAGMLDLKCFTPEMANGGYYGDCTFALTRLNLLERTARRLGVTLRASDVARQYGFPRSADGSWDDRYARVSTAITPPPQPIRESRKCREFAGGCTYDKVEALGYPTMLQCGGAPVCTRSEYETEMQNAGSILSRICRQFDNNSSHPYAGCTSEEVQAMSVEEYATMIRRLSSRFALEGMDRVDARANLPNPSSAPITPNPQPTTRSLPKPKVVSKAPPVITTKPLQRSSVPVTGLAREVTADLLSQCIPEFNIYRNSVLADGGGTSSVTDWINGTVATYQVPHNRGATKEKVRAEIQTIKKRIESMRGTGYRAVDLNGQLLSLCIAEKR